MTILRHSLSGSPCANLLNIRRALTALVIAVVVVTQTAAEAQQTVPKTSAGRLTFAAGSVSFVPPPGFTVLTADEISVKYPRGGAPRQAVSNAQGTTSIAYDLQELRAPSNDLEALRKALLQGFAQMPKLKYEASDVRRIGSRDWAYAEFTMAADDQDIHNIVLLSVHEGRILLFNFNSTVKEFPTVEQALRASMATIATMPSTPPTSSARAGAESSPPARPERASRFTLADGRIGFTAPPGFTALTAQEIALKYRRPGPPRNAVANAQRTSTIAYELLDGRASSDLEAGRKAITADVERGLKNVKWVVNEVHRLGTRDWIQLELTESSTGMELHHILLASVYDGHILRFTYTAPAIEFPGLERAFRASMATIATTP